MDHLSLGVLGEKVACEYLVGKKFKILGKNWRVSMGELDIVARKKWKLFARFDKTIHFVEVKTLAGNSDRFAPEDHVNWHKRQKLRQLALAWLQKHRYPQNYPYQIDIVAVLVNMETRKAKLHYFPNAVGE